MKKQDLCGKDLLLLIKNKVPMFKNIERVSRDELINVQTKMSPFIRMSLAKLHTSSYFISAPSKKTESLGKK